jgi:hypothetical protein
MPRNCGSTPDSPQCGHPIPSCRPGIFPEPPSLDRQSPPGSSLSGLVPDRSENVNYIFSAGKSERFMGGMNALNERFRHIGNDPSLRDPHPVRMAAGAFASLWRGRRPCIHAAHGPHERFRFARCGIETHVVTFSGRTVRSPPLRRHFGLRSTITFRRERRSDRGSLRAQRRRRSSEWRRLLYRRKRVRRSGEGS